LNSLPCETDERPQELQALTYTTPALNAPVTINGPINVHLVAESPEGRNSTLSVRITDVAPSGQSVGITAGWLLASMRQTAPSWVTSTVDGVPLRVFHPFTQASEQAVPVQATAYDIEVFPTLATFQAGHRIRLDISTGDVPHMAPSISHQASSVGTVMLIDRDPANPSYLSLPVAPAPAAAAAQTTGPAPSQGTGAATTTLPNTAPPAATPAAIAAVAILPCAAWYARRRRRLNA